jgi:hypothetical protein
MLWLQPKHLKERTMKVKGKKIINTDEAAEFANTVRGQYIISQALVMASLELKKYEIDEDATRSEPSNRTDMEFLLEAFPLYKIHEEAIWEERNESNV